MDPLSIIASTIAIVEAAGKVIQLLSALASSSLEARALAVEVGATRALISSLKELAVLDEAWNEKLLQMASGPLLLLGQLLQDLEGKLVLGTGDDERGEPVGRIKKWGKKLAWPFRMEETREMMKIARNVRSVLAASLAVDQLAVSRDIHEETREISRGIEKLRSNKSDQERSAILAWLSSTDVATTHTITKAKRVPTTGEWLLESSELHSWLNRDTDFMWIHGIPGSGKTVLCSAIIEYVQSYCENNTSGEFLCIYHYFAFDDRKRQTLADFIRSLLSQVCRQRNDTPAEVIELYAALGKTGQESSVVQLTAALLALLRQAGVVYLIMNALDESREQEEIIEFLSQIKADDHLSIQVLVTSRAERQIETGLQPLAAVTVALKGQHLDHDIEALIRWALESDPKLKTRPPVLKAEIQQTLVHGADGMFRWAACQLDTLRSCLSPSMVRKTLRSLPKGLDKTYDRILCGIDEDSRPIAFQALQFLTFSARLVDLAEIAEIIAIQPGISIFIELDRPFDPADVLAVCSSLVASYDGGRLNTLAHYSVKEYLLSDRIRNGSASSFAMREAEANIAIADRCMTYLLSFGHRIGGESTGFDTPSVLELSGHQLNTDFPLLEYAVFEWATHARQIPYELYHRVDDRILDLLDPQSPAFRHWISLFRPGEDETGFGTPLHYAAEHGLLYTVEYLVRAGVDLNAIGGFDGSALSAAIRAGHTDVVRVLLDNGADVDIAAGYYGCPLQTATARGQPRIALELIQMGADVNTLGGQFGTALQAAARYGQERCVDALLERGADVNATGGFYHTALQAAARGGHSSIILTLLMYGADAGIQGGFCGTALDAAYSRQNWEVAALLKAVRDGQSIDGVFE